MTSLTFAISLASDAEPGSGRGGELVDSYVPRDMHDRPVLLGSHIKGLMRARLTEISSSVGEVQPHAEDLLAACFGRFGAEGDSGALSRVRLADGRLTQQKDTLNIARTALGDLGTAATTTLRTTEAVPSGAQWTGTIDLLDAPEGGVADLAIRLALTAIEAVGGGRNRGAGACRVTIAGESRTPGALLQALAAALKTARSPEPRSAAEPAAAKALDPSAAVAWLDLTFVADGPVCCPETPEVKSNIIRSGFAIPASAVRGAIVTRLSEVDDALASACYKSDRFRAWPLLPARLLDDHDPLPWPVRVSLSHRVSKLPDEKGLYDFRDRLIESYDWRQVLAGSPLKAVDGVLLRADGGIRLWKAAQMPRSLSAHGVHWSPDDQSKRNLFTVEAMAPMVWRGLVALPAEAAQSFLDSLQKDKRVSFGKARTVRGGGVLSAAPLGSSPLDSATPAGKCAGRIFVAQSPLVLPEAWNVDVAGDALKRLAIEAGWGNVCEAHATLGIRFGWNRHTAGRLRARVCLLPGSVLLLERPLSDPTSMLLRGLGDGREAGFGAVWPHPGMAQSLYPDPMRKPPLRERGSNETGRLGFELWAAAKGRGPTASQIGAVLGLLRLQGGKEKALDFLERQEGRPERVWRVWRSVLELVRKHIQEKDSNLVAEALRMWQDLRIANRPEEDRS